MIRRAPSHERKTYVLDSNVLLHDPSSLFHFEEHEVVIPIVVIEEIDRFKKEQNDLGRNARHISRQLDDLRTTGDEDLAGGVALGERGGSLRIDLCEDAHVDWAWADPRSRADNMILSVSRRLNQAALLSQGVAEAAAVDHCPDLLIRPMRTRPTKGQSRDERYDLMQGSIAMHPKRAHLARGRHVVLIDDVMTTGATLTAASETSGNCAGSVTALWSGDG